MSICNLDHFAESYWQDQKFVLVSGCFDPLHEGHLAYFLEARKLGRVVCAVAPDADVAAKRTPFLPEQTRLAVLNACGLLEHVHLAVQGVPAVIRALKPSHYVVGDDWEAQLPQATINACMVANTEIEFADTRMASSTALLADYERRRNAEKLAALERFVQRQSPPKLWKPVTDYSPASRRAIEAPHADILADVFAGLSVLDYGCGFGYLVDLLQERHMDARGWDPQFRPTPTWTCAETVWDPDVVICREVLEHLPVPELATAIQHITSIAGRFVYVTTRFADDSHLLGAEGVDYLDPTHITMLNQDLLRTLFVLEGCTRRADLEARLDWQHKGRVLVYEVPHD